MQALLKVLGRDVLCAATESDVPELRLTGSEDEAPSLLDRLQGWSQRYALATEREDDDALRLLGREMFEALDGNGWAGAWADGASARVLQIQVDHRPGPLAVALLEAPWELLATDEGHLAADAIQPLVVTRRIGRPGEALVPRYTTIKMMFMAASPEGEMELDYEAEEVAILEATERLELQLRVEESGALAPLGDRLKLQGEPFDVLHLSCHGGHDPRLGPCLALESPEGGRPVPAFPADIAAALGTAEHTPLVFVSACQTALAQAAVGDGAAGAGKPPADAARPLASFVRELVRAGVLNVLGWDGSVHDRDSTQFTQAFYGELVGTRDIPLAAALARQRLLQSHREHASDAEPHRRRPGGHWHMARLYAGTRGGGALVRRDGHRRTEPPASDTRAFLDKAHQRSPVASRQRFVGRRRPLQATLRGLGSAGTGVLVLGMGNLGKSSLAARVLERRSDLTPVVLFQSFDRLELMDKLLEAVPAHEREALRPWRDRVRDDERRLADALEVLLRQLEPQPVLLILDDLEQALDDPGPQEDALTKARPGCRPVLLALLAVFAKSKLHSRLLLTSRYDFTLPDAQGRDLAQELVRVPLRPMGPREQFKQFSAAATPAQREQVDGALMQRVLAAADGNPGLQAVLMQPLLEGEHDTAVQVLQDWEHWREHGVAPEHLRPLIEQGQAADEGNALVAFFKRQAFEKYRDALTPEQAQVLGAATAFAPGLPVPLQAVVAAAQALGVSRAGQGCARLLALGLLDDWGVLAEVSKLPHVAANPLARPLVPALQEQQLQRWAEAALPVLDQAWQEDDKLPRNEFGAEAWRLAGLAPAAPAPVVDRAAAAAAWRLHRRHNTVEAMQQVLQPARERLRQAGHTASASLCLIMSDCAAQLGERDLQDEAAELMERQLDRMDGYDAAAAMMRLAERDVTRGRPGPAEALLGRAAELLLQQGSERDHAVVRGRIADILQDRGELDEALRIRREEQLPVYERLGDVRSKAVAQGRIADILQDRGELDEALRIRREEQLPVYERLGDVRSKAITQGRIADILQARGELDEALRIRQQEELPVYERLGDVRSKAITQGKIADILRARGELDEALRIRQEEQLPVFERLGDVRSKAVTQGQIADILQARGELDEALRIRQQEQLPVFDRLGNVREKAITQGKIADILQARGELDEALCIRRQEELPVYERLGDVRSKAITQGKIADILQARGELDEALRIRQQEELPVYERLGDVHSTAITQGDIADILRTRGELDEALALYERKLEATRALRDIDGQAHALYNIVGIRLQQLDHEDPQHLLQIAGQTREALEFNARLRRPDGILAVGLLHAQLLVMMGGRTQALELLDWIEALVRPTGFASRLGDLEALRAAIKKLPGSDDSGDPDAVVT